ncbi:MAG TPA: antitoxin Xre/MbcA/ParS toxin-binding domain-containing protein [Bryobacteraceae bacterium]|nr:antitoxin Xre/MbcA/ParS toxin-binding domain-containing protein [Bryobacteraceae bacterium]
MIVPSRTAKILGGSHVLGHRVTSIDALSRAVSAGLPKSALRQTAARVYQSKIEQRELMNRIVPEATFKRRRDRLSAAESERTERLARVIAQTEYVWNDRDDARQFLTTPHPALRGRTPLLVAMTELGARQVEEILDQIFYGLPA